MPVSFRPETFSAGSLIPDDIEATVTRCIYTAYDFNGKADTHQLVAAVTYQLEDDEEYTEYYPIGKLTDLAPSLDGETPTDLSSDDEDDWAGPFLVEVPGGKFKTIWGRSAWAHFMDSVFKTEFTTDETDNISAALEGHRFHLNRLPVPGRQQQPREDGRAPIHPLVPTVYLGAADTKPTTSKGAKKGTKTTKKSASTAAASSSPAADDDFQSEVAAVIINLLTENDGEMAKADLGRAVMASFDDPKQKAAAFGIATKSGDGWTVDGKTVTLG